MSTLKIVADHAPALDAGHKPSGRVHRIARAAEALDVSVSSVRRLIRSGHLHAIHVGGSVRVTETSLEALLEDGTRHPRVGENRRTKSLA